MSDGSVVADSEDDPQVHERNDRLRTQLRIISDTFASRLDESVFEGVRDEKIYHGLRVTTTTVLHKNFIFMCFCEATQETLLVERGVEIQRFSMQGKYLHPPYPLDTAFIFTRMIWCPPVEYFVCYDPDGELVWFLNSKCQHVKTMRNDFLIKSIYYEPIGNEIIVLGLHNSARYEMTEELEADLESVKALTYMDPEFGATWKLQCTSLIPPDVELYIATETDEEETVVEDEEPVRHPNLVSSYQTTIYLLALHAKDKSSDGTLEYLLRRTNATKATITALHYHKSNQWIIAGDHTGAVSGWTLSLDCVMSVSNAHKDKLLMFESHPSICGFLSFSYGTDGSRLQVWCCNFYGATESFTNLGEIYAIAVIDSAATVLVLSNKLYYLTMNQAYCFYAPLSDAASDLYSTQSPMYQTKVIATSEDNSVRIFSVQGKQLNVQILPKDTLKVVCARFSQNEKLLFTIILKSGEILVSDASSCPIKYKTVLISDVTKITCITVYEYFDEVRDARGRPRKPRVFYHMKVILFMGTEDGNIVVVDHETGKYEATISAHTGPVKQLRSSVKQQRAVSLGVDKCVKVWRVFGDLSSPLVLYYVLYFITPISHVGTVEHTLCVVNSSENSKVHQVIMENMAERMRLGHPASKDHTAPIIDMVISETLRLCATSSLDRTIRVWDHKNNLLKILEINTVAWKTTFSSAQADIIFSAGQHLYKIPFENYLPPKHRARIALFKLFEDEVEEAVPEDKDYRVYEDVVDREDMLDPQNTIPLDALDLSNSNMPRVDYLIMKQIFALYEYRDEDIRKIKDNILKVQQVLGKRKLMTTEGWKKYVNDLIKSLSPPPPDIPPHDIYTIREKTMAVEKYYNEYGFFQMLYGYPMEEPDEVEDVKELMKFSNIPLKSFLTNSVLYKDKVPEPPPPIPEPPPKKIFRYKYPPQFTGERTSETEEVESLRLSQLMDMDMKEGEEAGA